MSSTPWILVAGTGTDPLPAGLEATAELLGRALATAGLGLLTCGWPGVDRAVGQAFVAALGERGPERSGRFRQYRTRGVPPSVPHGEVVEVGQDAEEYLAAVDAADVVVLLGGQGGTLLIERHAALVGKPVLPLPTTGGDAQQVFEALRAGFDRERYLGIDRRELHALDQPADRAIGLALRCVRRHLAARDVRDGAYLTEDSVVGRDNELAFARLVEETREAGVLGFVGAGVSIPGGYPDWVTLVDRMQQALPDQVSRAMAYVSREEDLLMRAEQYRKLLGPPAFAAFVREQFGEARGTCGPLHEDLVRLPLTHVLTTNYDVLLEQAHVRVFPGHLPQSTDWHNDADIDAFLRALRRRGQRRHYIHLHGTFQRPESIVLTESDYQRRYHHTTAGEALLSVLFTAHPFLFIGFSFTDADMMGVFRGTMARLRLGQPLHFAFVGLDPRRHDPTLVRQRLQHKYKIDPVFYLLTPDHQGLHQLVRRLLEQTADVAVVP